MARGALRFLHSNPEPHHSSRGKQFQNNPRPLQEQFQGVDRFASERLYHGRFSLVVAEVNSGFWLPCGHTAAAAELRLARSMPTRLVDGYGKVLPFRHIRAVLE